MSSRIPAASNRTCHIVAVELPAGDGMQRLPRRSSSDLISLSARTIGVQLTRSEEHTSELQSLMRISYDVFCLKKKTTPIKINTQIHINYTITILLIQLLINIIKH